MFNIQKPIYAYDLANTTKYAMTKGAVDVLIQKLNEAGGPFSDIIGNKLNSDVAGYIYSIRQYPLDILDKVKYLSNGQEYYNGIISGSTGSGNLKNPNLTTAKMMKQITIGDKTNTPTVTDGVINYDGTIDGYGVYLMGAVMDEYNGIVELGKIQIPRLYNNYLDLAPYTAVEVYLPYCGMVSLDPNECMGKTIHIQYIIDFGSGMATSYITTWETDQDVLLLDNRNFKIAIDHPIQSNNAADISRDQVLRGMSLGTNLTNNIISSNYIGAVTGGAQGITSALFAQVPKFNKGSEASGSNATYAEQKVQVFITRPKALYTTLEEDMLYNSLKGKPAQVVNVPLSQLINTDNYFEVGDIHLTGFTTATSTEIDMIERALKSGVIG